MQCIGNCGFCFHFLSISHCDINASSDRLLRVLPLNGSAEKQPDLQNLKSSRVAFEELHKVDMGYEQGCTMIFSFGSARMRKDC